MFKERVLGGEIRDAKTWETVSEALADEISLDELYRRCQNGLGPRSVFSICKHLSRRKRSVSSGDHACMFIRRCDRLMKDKARKFSNIRSLIYSNRFVDQPAVPPALIPVEQSDLTVGKPPAMADFPSEIRRQSGY